MPFQKGNKLGGGVKGKAGRKSKAEELGLEKLLADCWTDKDRRVCIKNLAIQANRGEMEAVKLLMSYAYGKPTEKHQHSGDEKSPIEIRVIYDS
jgi:hypothetical protein